MNWIEIKTELVENIGVSKDALHVLVSVVALLVFAKFTRRKISHPLPLMLVFALEFANEWLDILNRGGIARMNARLWADGIKDLALTSALPFLLFAAARYWPEIFVLRKRHVDSETG